MPINANDVTEITSPQTRKTLLGLFRSKLFDKTLYLKKNNCFLPALDPPGRIKHNGFFIYKETLQALLAAIDDEPTGCVLVNFAIGPSPTEGQQLQLMFTALDKVEQPTATDLGKLCLTTAYLGGFPTTPPLGSEPCPPRRDDETN